MEIYIVQPNDTVDTIAERFGVSTDSIILTNQLIYPYALAVGQALLINTGQTLTSRPPLVTNGYAYPFIMPPTLDITLPFLTELSVFSYGFTEEGELIPPQIDESWMIEQATENNARAILTLTPFGADGKFNNQLIHSLLMNEMAEDNLISNLLIQVSESGYGGVDIDFEFILPEDRELFVAFVRKTTERLNESGYQVSVALAPKVSDTQPGLLYEGKDYAALGAAANKVLLMTYEWGYTYGPPMAVAPINKVREVVDYALTRIPAEKIMMGIPNYGYDWALPFERGVTKAITIGNIDAVNLAVKFDAEILFDELSQTPYFHYMENDIEHEVWFEDVRSIQAKLELVEEKDLLGIGYWQIMKLFLPGLEFADYMFNIKKIEEPAS